MLGSQECSSRKIPQLRRLEPGQPKTAVRLVATFWIYFDGASLKYNGSMWGRSLRSLIEHVGQGTQSEELGSAYRHERVAKYVQRKELMPGMWQEAV
jgi:hypothetical protein